MGALKKFIEIFSTDTAFGRALSPALQEISDRLDAIDKMEKKQNTINSSILDVLDMLKQKAHSHYMDDGGLRVCREELDDESQDERSCENCGVGHMECHTDGVRPYCDEWQPKQPKAQEQGGKDKKVSGCFYDHESCDVVDDLRARLALLEKENARLNCDLNRMWSPEAELKAHITRLEKENAELKRGLFDAEMMYK